MKLSLINCSKLILVALTLVFSSCGSDDPVPTADDGKSAYEFTVNSGELAGKKFMSKQIAIGSPGFITAGNGELLSSSVSFFESYSTNTLFKIYWDGERVLGFQPDESKYDEGYIRLVAVEGDKTTIFESLNVTCQVTDIKTVVYQDPIIKDQNYNLRDFKMTFSGTFRNKSDEETTDISGSLQFVNNFD
ncbi:hypothetical protein MM239_08705 [Belliella sp. DSM 111904]|uniref:Uncharacterized protein n=1 Tax=Belliella filtrata TaxID=2923435 RepID=A0ABS9UZ84_9BACT|nr:hypothetical protein [Belliella filtrata]MCH7409472.1 hypothetical protein [Belliella filtrata]